MELRVLGPVELWVAGREVPLGRPRQRCVLAALALARARPVGMDQLLERVWGERLPGDARNAVYTYVSRLRRVLERAGAGRGQDVLRRTGGGYLLDVDPDLVDLHRSRRLAAEARALEDGGRAVRLWEEAASLWRGMPLAGLTGDWAERTRAALEQERLAILTGGLAARLRLGPDGPAAVMGSLSQSVAEHPLNEPLAGLLMLALYRGGRQADALAVYAGLRERLVEEIGDEPGERLRQLHERILRRDPALDQSTPPPDADARGAEADARAGEAGARGAEAATEHGGGARGMPGSGAAGAGSAGVSGGTSSLGVSAGAGPVGVSGRVTPAQLPADVAQFTGRATDLERLDTLVRRHGASRPAMVLISGVEGMPGVGKTALAVHWAHRVRDRFADGQLYVDLRGYAPQPPLSSIEALARLLRALGVPPERIPAEVEEAAAMYRSVLADRRMLLVVDNAASAEQVRPLLPGGGGSVVLVTSRGGLGGLVARDGAHRMNLDVLPLDDATALMGRILGAERAAAEREAVTELAELCDRLPLALRIAAANLATRPRQRVADYVARLRTGDRLTALSVAGDPYSAVLVSFDLSYAHLSVAARRVFRLLALAPGPDVTAAAAAALAGLGTAAAEGLLEELARAHLVEERATGRYTCHDLLRHYAGDLAAREESEAGRAAARARLYDHYLSSADAAARILYPHMSRLPIEPDDDRGALFPAEQPALAWLDEEFSCLVAVVRHTSRHGPHRVAWLLADALRGYFWLRRPMVDWLTVAEAALTAAEADGEPHAQAAAWLSRADADQARGRHQDALALYQRVRRAGQDLEGSTVQDAALSNMGMLCLRSGRLAEAAACFEHLLALNLRHGSLLNEALQLGNLGAVHRAMGQLERAADLHTRARAIHRRAGITKAEATALRDLGEIHHQSGRFDQAHRFLAEALSLHRRSGDPVGEAEALLCLSSIRRDTGRPALDLARAALGLARDIGDARLEADAFNTLGSIHHRLGEHLQAVEHHRQALGAATDIGLGHARAEALIGLAAAHRDLGGHDRAHELIEQATTVVNEAGFRLLEGHVLTVLTGLWLAEADLRQALRTGRRALAVHRETGHRLGEAHTHLLLGRAHERAGDTGEAGRHLLRARDLLADLGIPSEPSETRARGTDER
ncbi:BTAD domain-containing putative transcriptional regulator [Nonomuraea sp. NPDC050643]|uniref:AfsR/SARP family transcriptional regulator n=1 Tax=Nonomuraea sp. NPDC050643 TaxID=3155660 RepID=UPI0033C800E4